jgi:CRISPR-associated protein Cas6
MTVDLLFPVHGDSVPTDHAYALYAALSGAVPAFHDPASPLRFAPLTGGRGGPGRLLLNRHSALRVRLPSDALPTVLPLAGTKLDVAGSAIRLGPPSVHTLVPAASLESWLVTFKNSREPDRFLDAARAKLAELGVTGTPTPRAIPAGPRAGEPRRRVVRVQGKAIVGYALLVTGLSAPDALRLQEHGLGGRTKLGCGFFLPAREAK